MSIAIDVRNLTKRYSELVAVNKEGGYFLTKEGEKVLRRIPVSERYA